MASHPYNLFNDEDIAIIGMNNFLIITVDFVQYIIYAVGCQVVFHRQASYGIS